MKLENTRAYEVVSSTTRKIAKIMGQLPKRVEEPPHIIVMPQELIPEESVFTWKLGFDGNLANIPHIAVIYGRGRWLGPLLTGERKGAGCTGFSRLLAYHATVGLIKSE